MGCLSDSAFSILLVYLLIVVNFPVLARSLHHPDGAAGGIGRDRVVSVHHGDDDQRAGADRSDHVHGRGDRQQHSGGELFKGTAGGGENARGSGLEAGYTRFRPVLMTALGDDHRYASDVAGLGRRRRAECALGPRSDRGPDFCNGGYALLCAGILQFYSRTGAGRIRATSGICLKRSATAVRLMN